MVNIRLRNGTGFTAEPGETMLSAALRGGVMLEHSCKTGRCGTCKVRIVDGSSVPVGAETGLSDADRAAGLILSCVREASSDVTLDADELGNMTIHQVKTLACRISSLEHMGPGLLRLTLRLPPSQRFDYHPGQYFELLGRDGLRRSYSAANAPGADAAIELHVRRVPSGQMSDYLFGQAKVNELLRISGPLGTFFLRDVEGRDLILLATGTGMAPVKAMLEGMAAWSAERRPRSIRVYWGVRRRDELYWNPREAALELDYVPVLSGADSSWTGRRGHVQDVLAASDVDLGEALVFASGSPAMIEGARSRLIAAGLSERRFHADAFVASAPVLTR